MHVEIENEDCINIELLLREPREKAPKYFSVELRGEAPHLAFPYSNREVSFQKNLHNN